MKKQFRDTIVFLCIVTIIWFLCACASYVFCWAFDLPWNLKMSVGVFVAYIVLKNLTNIKINIEHIKRKDYNSNTHFKEENT